MLRFLPGAAAIGAFGLALLASAVIAQPAKPPPAPASKDPATAPAGAYKLDTRHTSVIARVAHQNTVSYSIFRFGAVSGTLDWDPAKVESSKVDINLETNSIATPVAGFAEELVGERFLNSAKFPGRSFRFDLDQAHGSDQRADHRRS